MAAIYYAFTLPPLSGGHFVALEHVAALQRAGFNARILYLGPEDGAARFGQPVARAGTPLSPDDVVVAGEDHRGLLTQLRGAQCRKVLHHQAVYYTFAGFETVDTLRGYPFAHVLVPSDFCADKLRAMGVGHPISRVRPGVPDYFRPLAKTLSIAVAPRKRPIEANFLQGWFGARVPDFAGVPWVPLNGLSRPDCAKALGGAAVFAALPLLESLGLMNLEAMAAGCHVVGYTGHGGSEYARADNGDWIADGDHDAFVETLAQACRLFRAGADNPRIAAGAATAAAFTPANFERELLAAWDAILGGRAALYRP